MAKKDGLLQISSRVERLVKFLAVYWMKQKNKTIFSVFTIPALKTLKKCLPWIFFRRPGCAWAFCFIRSLLLSWESTACTARRWCSNIQTSKLSGKKRIVLKTKMSGHWPNWSTGFNSKLIFHFRGILTTRLFLWCGRIMRNWWSLTRCVLAFCFFALCFYMCIHRRMSNRDN